LSIVYPQWIDQRGCRRCVWRSQEKSKGQGDFRSSRNLSEEPVSAMTLTMNVTLTPALRAQEPTIQNMVQLYTHDFSEFWSGTARGDLGSDGRFDSYPLDDYWSRPGWSAAFILSDGVL